MTIYSAILCAALLWLGLWALWPGPKRDNCRRCEWGLMVCTHPLASGAPELEQIQSGQLICPWRERR